VFPPRRISSQGRRPQNGSARTGKLSYFTVAYGNRSNQLARLPRQPLLNLWEIR